MLYFFYETPFSVGTQLDPVDTYAGTGAQVTFTLVNKQVGSLASTITFNNTQYAQYSNGFTKNASNNTFTLATAPANGSVGVAPGISALTGAAFDNDNVPGVTNPREVEVPFWYGDPYNINQFTYLGFPADPGIGISFVNETSGFGADTSWCSLACANASGGPLTYGATGSGIWVGPLNAFGSLAASAAAGASSIFCGTASSFTAGDYIAFNVGQVNFEICHISNVVPFSYRIDLDSGGPNFDHAEGELFYAALRKGWAKFTIPTNQTNNSAANYYNLAIRRRARINARP